MKASSLTVLLVRRPHLPSGVVAAVTPHQPEQSVLPHQPEQSVLVAAAPPRATTDFLPLFVPESELYRGEFLYIFYEVIWSGDCTPG